MVPMPLAGVPASRSSVPPPHEGRVPVLAGHPDMRSRWTHRTRMSSRCPHAGFPQGFLTRRKSHLVSCLADECYRPNCQRIGTDPRLGTRHVAACEPGIRPGPRSLPLDAVGRSRCPQDTHPGRLPASGFVCEAKAILTDSGLRSTPSSDFFQNPSRLSEACPSRPRLDVFGRFERLFAAHPGRLSDVGHVREARAMISEKTPGSTPPFDFSENPR